MRMVLAEPEVYENSTAKIASASWNDDLNFTLKFLYAQPKKRRVLSHRNFRL